MPTVFQVADKIFKKPQIDYLNATGMIAIRIWRSYQKQDPPRIEETNGKETFQVFNYPQQFQEVIKYLLMGKKHKAKFKEAIKNYEQYLQTGVFLSLEKKTLKKKDPKQVASTAKPKRKRKRIVKGK